MGLASQSFKWVRNADGTATGAYPEGDKPTDPPPEPSIWAYGGKGDADGSMIEVDEATIQLTANGTNLSSNMDVAYRTISSAQEIEFTAVVQGGWLGYGELFTGFGIAFLQGLGANDYFSAVWRPQSTQATATSGTSASQTTVAGETSTPLPRYFKLTLKQGLIRRFESGDGETWIEIGTAISHTFTFPMLVGVIGTSHAAGEDSTATISGIEVLSTVVTDPGPPDPPDPDPDPPGPGEPTDAEFIYRLDYSQGNYDDWVNYNNWPNDVIFPGVPAYGRPIDYGGKQIWSGNGALMELVAKTERTVNGVHYNQGPTRGRSEYANKLTCKSTAGGSTSADADGANNTRRRTELWFHVTMPRHVPQGLPYLSHRYISISHYIPSNWNSTGGASWGPLVIQLKSPPTINIGPTLMIQLQPNIGWVIRHSWSDVNNPNSWDVVPWYYQMDWTSALSATLANGLAQDYPNINASKASLADFNKGKWRDWVIDIKFDGRRVSEGGTGHLNIYTRIEGGNWLHLVAAVPRLVAISSSISFQRGIGFKIPGSGYGPITGMYMDNEQVLPLAANRVIYNTGFLIGDPAQLTLADMTPDGTDPTA